MKKILTILLISTLLSSCGTIFKSERNFKTPSKQIDYNILALDLLGLPLFIIPGAVMIMVDSLTGALYLPPEEAENFVPTSIQPIVNNLLLP